MRDGRAIRSVAGHAVALRAALARRPLGRGGERANVARRGHWIAGHLVQGRCKALKPRNHADADGRRNREPRCDKRGCRSRPLGALVGYPSLAAAPAALAQELVAFRLYAPYFGYSIYVWGSMISVVMAGLALGYALGGRMPIAAEPISFVRPGSRQPGLPAWRPLPRSFRSSHLCEHGRLHRNRARQPVRFRSANDGDGHGLPFLIRLLARSERVGALAGKIYALSTMGGIAGVLATSFFRCRNSETRTLEAICLLSAATAVPGLALHAALRCWRSV